MFRVAFYHSNFRLALLDRLKGNWRVAAGFDFHHYGAIGVSGEGAPSFSSSTASRSVIRAFLPETVRSPGA
jgi:hypothetical protein